MTPHPNFLFIITDQQRADHLGCYGNHVVKTPHIDSIAANGVRFDRFFVANPSCMPNRATLMTGQMPSSHGVWSNGVPLSLNANTVVNVLRHFGYDTALVGKCHLQSFTGIEPVTKLAEPSPGVAPLPANLCQAKSDPQWGEAYEQELYSLWEANEDFRMRLPYYGFEHVDLLVQHGDELSGHYAQWARARCPNYRALRGAANEAGGHDITCPWAWRTSLPEEVSGTAFVEDRTCAWLEQYAARRDGPFFLQCSFADPHHPFVPSGSFWDMYRPQDIELPPSFAQVSEPPPHLAALWQQRDDGSRDRWSHLPQAITAKEAREAIALTYGMISRVDGAVGNILGQLKRLGLAENTVVVFCSDHGDLMGDHQVLLKGPLHYRGLVRTPFMWADPAGARGMVVDGLCSAIDFAPTVLARAGIQAFYGIQGQSLLPAMLGETIAREAVLIEEDPQRTFMGFQMPPRARTVVTAHARLTLFERTDFGELYDLQTDPHEMHNLWHEPAHAGMRSAMLETLAREMTRYANRTPLPTHRG
jgi:arylsulfatase A-like enzyme